MQDYSAIVLRICPQRADDLDDLLSPHGRRTGAPGREVFPQIGAALMPEPHFKRTDAICIGIAVQGDLGDASERAMRLAAMALERDVEIIVLSEVDTSGLERFGFRTERMPSPGEPAHDGYLDQVRRFWGLDLVL